MQPFEAIVLLLAVAVGLGIVSRWLGVAYPILLVLAGLLLSLQPGSPTYTLPPDLVFLAFLPPLLYAAAFNTNWPAFRTQLRPITLLAVGLVLFTTAGVAWAAHQFLGMDWGPAFVLGAIVAPPDAVAATAITQRVRIPRVVVTVLEGESLVNDAAALVAYRMAVAAVVTGVFSVADAGARFLLVAGGGIAVGLAGGCLVVWMHRWLNRSGLADAKLTIAVTLLAPYAVYLPAEHLHVSGVLAVVAAGMWVGWRCEVVFPNDLYAEARPVWEMVEFLLNAAIFILIGFQLPAVLSDLRGDYPPERLAGAAALISAVVILTRIVWMFPGAYVPRWLDRRLLGKGDPYPPWQNVSVVAWTGMRGVVSLAAALAIPRELSDGKPFPDRGLIQFLTFWVIFATLVGQGLTLPLLIRWLGVDNQAGADQPDPVEVADC